MVDLRDTFGGFCFAYRHICQIRRRKCKLKSCNRNKNNCCIDYDLGYYSLKK